MNKCVKLIKIRLTNGKKIKILQLFGKNILYIEKDLNKKIKFYLRNNALTTNPSDNIFYLKINTIKDHSLECFQKWIDIANKKNAKVYIVCDDKKTELSLYKNIRFHDNFEVIRSKIKKLYPYVKSISCKFWYNAVLAKLAIFYHASKHGHKNFWKIDADDTMFCIENDDIVTFLQNAEQISNEQNIKAFSLDMHTSKLYGKHWSFGVCYIDNTIDWFSIFQKYMNNGWKEKYNQRFKEGMNLDWFFTYLRDEKILNIKSFYINKSYFYYYHDRSSDLMKLSHWNNNKLIYPHLKCVNSYFGERPIFLGNICIGNAEASVYIKQVVSKDYNLYNLLAIYDNLEILYPPQGLGDILFVCGLIREYKRSNPNKKIAILVTKKHFYDFAKLYQNEFFDVIFYNKKLRPYYNFVNLADLADLAYRNKTFYEIINKHKNFKNLFTSIMNLNKKCMLYYPEIEKIRDNTLSNSILIAPDSVSIPASIDDVSWISLADKLKEKGFDVIFNCNNKERFKNYKKNFWDIKTTIQKINNMKAFIGYRSGLTDVIGAFCRETKQYIIYPEERYTFNADNVGAFKNKKESIEAYFNFCSIKNNFNNNLVNEYIYNKDVFDTILDEIV